MSGELRLAGEGLLSLRSAKEPSLLSLTNPESGLRYPSWPSVWPGTGWCPLGLLFEKTWAGCSCFTALVVFSVEVFRWVEFLLTAALPPEGGGLDDVITVCCAFWEGSGFWSRSDKSTRSSRLNKPSSDSSMSGDSKLELSMLLSSSWESSGTLGRGE